MILDLGVLFGLLAVGFWLWAVFDSITSPAHGVRNLPKLAWVLIVLASVILGPLLWTGGLAWVLLGRPTAASVANRGPGGPAAGGRQPGDGANWLRRAGQGGLGTPGDRPRATGSAGRDDKQPPIGPDDDPDFLRGL